jgi:hypothetical protein
LLHKEPFSLTWRLIYNWKCFWIIYFLCTFIKFCINDFYTFVMSATKYNKLNWQIDTSTTNNVGFNQQGFFCATKLYLFCRLILNNTKTNLNMLCNDFDTESLKEAQNKSAILNFRFVFSSMKLRLLDIKINIVTCN